MPINIEKGQRAGPTRDDLIALARIDFGVFAVLLFPYLHDGKQMIPAPYLDLMAQALMCTTSGGSKRVIFNLPPGHMKSLLVSILYSAWRLGVNPSEKIICVSYGDDLAHDLSRKTRKVMQSPMYKAVFPGTELDQKAADSITTSKGGQRYATATGSDIAGFRANLILLDDLMQPDEAASELAKQKLRDWYSGVVAQRLLDQSTGVIVLVMHRLAPDDLTATLVAEGGWLHIALPLIAVGKENYFTKRKSTLLSRNPGDILNKAWMQREAADELQRTLPPHIWEAQYQQNPQYNGSGICSIHRLVRYPEAPDFELKIHAWDLAATKGDGDWTVCAQFGLAKNAQGRDILYLTKIIRIRVELPDVRSLIVEQDKLDKPALIVLDANGVGLGIYQDLANQNFKHVMHSKNLKEIKTGDQKVRRFHLMLPHLYDGLIQIPESMPGLEVLLNEIAAFPDGKHDDQVDAMTTFGAHMKHAINMARINAERHGRWSPDRLRRLDEARRNQPVPQRKSRYFDRG